MVKGGNKMKLILPSAKIVPPELQIIGKLPAIIYPFNKGIVLDYLLEQYSKIFREAIIVGFEEFEKVKQRISSYNNYNLRLLKLDQLKDLGYTIYNGLIQDEEPKDDAVIINFADTIVMDNINETEGDCYFYAEDCVSGKWTFFEEQNGIITSILDKKEDVSNDNKNGKLFVGVFKIKHPEDFKRCFDWAFKNKSDIDFFYVALMKYSQMYPLKAIKTENWFDIGHADKYYNSQLGVQAREFNHITVDKERGILHKTSDDKNKFIGEILWYLKLPADIEYVRPRIFSYSTSYTSPYVELEYYSYHTVHELYLYGDLSYNQWVDIFKRVKFIYKDFARYELHDKGIKESLEDMYMKKTLERLKTLKRDKRFAPFFEHEFVVNGVKYKSINEIIVILKTLLPRMLYDVEKFNIIHGDLCFSNILVDSNFTFIKVIDPRGKFGKYDIYGDARYELAKLFHSVDGKYDFIIKDLFAIDVDKEALTIDFPIIGKNSKFDLYECLLNCFKDEIGDQKPKIELIEALLFLSMIPLHNESVNHQYAMLGTGIQILDRVTDIRAKDELLLTVV